MTRAVLDSPVIIALSSLDLFNRLEKLFSVILILQSVYDEVCIKGKGLAGDKPLEIYQFSRYIGPLYQDIKIFKVLKKSP